MASGQFIAYYRVSTQRQGRSGLGIAAQKKAVLDFLDGGRWSLVAAFEEHETGRDNERPKLREAMALCRVRNATLVIARIDRLSRNAHFLLGLQEARVRFVAADMPDANELTVGIMAVIAQAESKRISANTKAAMAAAQARGRKLGHIGNLTAAGRAKGRPLALAAKTAKAKARVADLTPTIREIQRSGQTSLRQIAAELNTRGIGTARGKQWTSVQVMRLLAGIDHTLGNVEAWAWPEIGRDYRAAASGRGERTSSEADRRRAVTTHSG